MMNDTYFPILVRYTYTNEQVIVLSPYDIASGRAFVVLETNYPHPES